MLIKILNSIAILGDRIERGAIVNVSDHLLSNIDKNDYEVINGKAGVSATSNESEDESEEDLENLSTEQLKAKAKNLGLKTSGSKKDLVERINLFLSSSEEEEDESEEEDEEEEGE